MMILDSGLLFWATLYMVYHHHHITVCMPLLTSIIMWKLVTDEAFRRHFLSGRQNESTAPCHKLSSIGRQSAILPKIICMIQPLTTQFLASVKERRHTCLHIPRHNVSNDLALLTYSALYKLL